MILHSRINDQLQSYFPATKSNPLFSTQGLLNVLRNGTPEEFRSKMKNHLFNFFEKV